MQKTYIQYVQVFIMCTHVYDCMCRFIVGMGKLCVVNM